MISKLEELRTKNSNPSNFMTRAEKFRLKKLKILLEYDGNTSQIERFKSLAKNHPKRNFILVYSPQHWSKLKGLPNYDEVIYLLSELDKIDNIKVLDYSKFELPDEFYHDSGHMNIKGAQSFSSMMKKDLQRILN